MTVTIMVGDVRAQLRLLKAESVHCIWTSVPYWGLRTYDTVPQIWGGTDRCDHVWADALEGDRRRGQRGSTSQFSDRSVNDAQVMGRQASKGCFCTACGAWKGEHGLEPTLSMWLANEVLIWRELARVLRKDGVAWLNCGDAYVGSAPAYKTNGPALKPKQRLMLPARLAIALQEDGAADVGAMRAIERAMAAITSAYEPEAVPDKVANALECLQREYADAKGDSWWLRDEVVWDKPNPMPSSVSDRTTPAHEMLYMLTKSPRYFFDNVATMEPMLSISIQRLSQKSVDAQKGGPKQDLYDAAGINLKVGSRRPNEIIKGLAKKAAATPRNDGDRWNENEGRGFLPRGMGKNEQTGDPRKDGFNDRWNASQEEPAAAAVGRNKRSVWRIPTEPFPDAHFATAPTKLVEPCILASTSAKGCCPACQTAWERQTRKSYVNPGNRGTNGPRSVERKHIDGGTAGYGQRLEASVTTLGWYPTCACDGLPALPRYPKQGPDQTDEDFEAIVQAVDRQIETMCGDAAGTAVIPCTVLDCFLGSGTTAVVADRLGCDVIGIDLNPDYARMAHRRIQDDAPLLVDIA